LKVFTYRYFLHSFPDLGIFAISEDSNQPIGCVVCKIDGVETNEGVESDAFGGNKGDEKPIGYMAMLAVDKNYRRLGIGTALVERAVGRMKEKGCVSVTLETEVSNKAAMKLYEERLGFIREDLLVRYYLNWGDAYRLRLWLDNDDFISNSS